jgi:uncharacterized membrane protein
MADSTGHLHVLALPDPLKAQELLMALARLDTHGQVNLADAVFVQHDIESGKVRVLQTSDMSPGEGAVTGGFWGLVVGTLLLGPIGGLAVGAASSAGGALIGKLVDAGIPEAFIKQVKEVVPPGWTALVVETKGVDMDAFSYELSRFPDAKPLIIDLTDDTRSRASEGFVPSDELQVG